MTSGRLSPGSGPRAGPPRARRRARAGVASRPAAAPNIIPCGRPAAVVASGSEMAGSPVAFCSGVNATQLEHPLHDRVVVLRRVQVARPAASRCASVGREHHVVGGEELLGEPARALQPRDRQRQPVQVAAGVPGQAQGEVVAAVPGPRSRPCACVVRCARAPARAATSRARKSSGKESGDRGGSTGSTRCPSSSSSVRGLARSARRPPARRPTPHATRSPRRPAGGPGPGRVMSPTGGSWRAR